MTTTSTSTTPRVISTSLSPRPEAAILPSLPPSPSLLDEVFSHPRPWSEGFDLQHSRWSSRGPEGSPTKGKAKQSLDDEDEDDENAPHRVSTHEAYPPMTDQTAETRRVEETLKRWELAERQRRKSVRESAPYAGPSLLATVTRTASLVLSGRNSIGTAHITRALKSHDAVDVAREGYGVPLDDIDHAHLPTDVAVHSPIPSVFERGTSMDAASGSGSENPFEHPSERTCSPTPLLTPTTPTRPRPSTPSSPSPFSDTHAQQDDLGARGSGERPHTRTRSKGGKGSGVPPPRPLGLPPPKDAPHMAPLRPTPRPILRPSRQDPEERQEVRWWHDWLCGCGEGPDRGGDNQAGRTNPFE